MTDPALKEAVERVTAAVDDYDRDIADDLAEDGDLGHVDDGLREFALADIRALLATISSQAESLEAMASALEELVPGVTAYTMSGSDLAQGIKRHAWEPALKRARTTLTQYRKTGDL